MATLTPVGKYYFGGDMTFQVGNDEKNEYNRQYSSYIIKSELFPQQTSLLGMLRFFLLSHSDAFSKVSNKIIVENQDRAKILIGYSSFMVTEDEKSEEINYGVISKIHPCFIQMGNSQNSWINLLPAPADNCFHIHFAQSCDAHISGSTQPHKIPWVEGYDPKAEYKTLFISSDNRHKIDFSNIFSEEQQIGINRDIKTGKVKDSSLYKQICYRLKSDPKRQFRFAFAFEINDNIETDFTNQILSWQNEIVKIGGDNSSFVLKIEKMNNLYPIQYPTPEQKQYDCYGKVTLLSDSYLSETHLDKALYSITKVKPFRFLSTTIHTEDYNVLSGKISRSKRYNLYNAGSVFYFDREDSLNEFTEALESYKNFRQIGYNQYQKHLK